MTKKLIAIVLFVAMMLAIVPVASAAVLTSDPTQLALTIAQENAPWYVGEVPALYANHAITGNFKGSNSYTGTEYGDAGKALEEFEYKVSGSYNGLQPFYYMEYIAGYNAAKCIQIPFTLFYQGVDVTDAALVGVSSEIMGVSASTTKLNNQTGEKIRYINFLPTANDGVYYATVSYGGYSFNIKIVWDNTDNNGGGGGGSPSPLAKAEFNLLGIYGPHANTASGDGNYRAAYQKSVQILENGAYNYYPGILNVNIAGYTKQDQDKIFDLSKADLLGFYFQALDNAGNALPIRTIITMKTEDPADWIQGTGFSATYFYSKLNATTQQYEGNVGLGRTSKQVDLNGNVTYLLGENGTFYLELIGMLKTQGVTLDDGTVLPNIPAWATYATVWYPTGLLYARLCKLFMGRISFTFNYGVAPVRTLDAYMDVYFNNVERSYASLINVDDAVTVKLGETIDLNIEWSVQDAWTYGYSSKVITSSTSGGKISLSGGNKVTGVAEGLGFVQIQDTVSGQVYVVLVYVVNPNATPGEVQEEVKAQKLMVITQYTRLNVRSGPSTDFSIVGKMQIGEVCEEIEVSGAWYKIKTASGLIGYSHGKYLAEIN